MTSRRASAPALLSLAALLTSCGGSAPEGAGDGGQTRGSEATLTVAAGFYPLEFVLEQVAGDLVEVVSLTAAGVDPHDLELSPQEVARVGEADLVVYAAGMQPALDQAVGQQAPDSSYDVTEAADLVATGTASGDEHADDEGEDGHAEEHEHGDEDPHFWLDPERYGAVATAVAEQLAELDPDHAQEYRDNAAAMVEELGALDEEFAQGLADCRSEAVVTSHAAFGYLTDRYGLRQVAITGLSPESEPSPARIAEISQTVREQGVDTIYAEVLLGEELAQTVAAETGADVRLLDPLEGLTDASPGSDYGEVMRANLATLREGQDCS